MFFFISENTKCDARKILNIFSFLYPIKQNSDLLFDLHLLNRACDCTAVAIINLAKQDLTDSICKHHKSVLMTWMANMDNYTYTVHFVQCLCFLCIQRASMCIFNILSSKKTAVSLCKFPRSHMFAGSQK